jgi:hypothetical protein
MNIRVPTGYGSKLNRSVYIPKVRIAYLPPVGTLIAAAYRWRFWELGWIRDGAALSFILLCVFIFFKDAILSGLIFFEPDTISYYYPANRQLDEALKQGKFQLWTPYIFGGFHLFADGETGALYPPRLLLLSLFNADQATIWLRVLRFFMAGAFTYAFARQIKLCRYSALVAGLIFPLSSFMVAQLPHANLSNTAVWLPLILLFIERGITSLGYRRYCMFVLAGVAFGISCLGVHPQPVLLISFAVSLYIAFRTFTIPAEYAVWTGLPIGAATFNLNRLGEWLSSGRLSTLGRGWARALPLWSRFLWPRCWLAFQVLAIMFLAGLSLAAAQLIPLYYLSRDSFRGYPLWYGFASTFASAPHHLVNLVLPYFFRTADGGGWSLWAHWETIIYIGIIPLTLAIMAVLFARQRFVWFFAVLALLALWAAMGDYPPLKLYWLIFQVPGFSLVRAPGRFLLLFCFSGAILAGYGAQWLVSLKSQAKTDVHVRTRLWLGTYALALAVAGMFLWLGMNWLREWLVINRLEAMAWLANNYLSGRRGNYLLSVDSAYANLLNTALDVSSFHAVVAFSVVFAAGGILGVWAIWPRIGALWRGLLLGLMTLELLVFASNFHPLMPVSKLANLSPVGQFLVQANGIHRVHTPWTGIEIESNRLLPYSIASTGGYSSLRADRHRTLMEYVDRGHLRLLDLMSVRYIVDARSVSRWSNAGYRVVFENADVLVYENPKPMPRATVLPAVVIARSPDSIPSWINDRAFDINRIGILEEAQGAWQDERIRKLMVTPFSGEETQTPLKSGAAEIALYSPERVVVRTQNNTDGLLMLADAFDNGWQVRVDGQIDKIYLTDYLFRGVFVPAGEHIVEFEFVPQSFRVGVIISLASLITIVTFFVYGWRHGLLRRG